MDKLHVSITIFLSKRNMFCFLKENLCLKEKKIYLLKKLDLKNLLFDLKNLIKKNGFKIKEN